MSQKNSLKFLGLILGVVAGLCFWFFHTHSVAIFSPQGTIAAKERNLIVLSTLLMLIVVVPVYIMTFTIAWKYREGNTKAHYSPNWDHNNVLEFFWWAIPMAIITILAVVTYKSSHDLDPFKSISSSKPPITIQVVALQWKWLFIYPDQGIASVNYLQIPRNTPVNFEITADSPMNSFWVPQLGGQIYAMPGMSTELHLVADQSGVYRGVSANLSGKGFAGMDFSVESVSSASFNQWISYIHQTNGLLNQAAYTQLAAPSQNQPVSYYGQVKDGVYDSVLSKYLVPPNFQVVSGLSRGTE